MRFPLRRLRSPFLAITFLVLVAVITLVSLGESFKVLAIRKDGITVKKRDGSTITFDLPWKSAHDRPIDEVKAVSPIASGILGAVFEAAGAMLNEGTNVADNVASEAKALTSTTLAAAAGLSGAVPATSVVHDLNIAVSQGAGIVGIIVGDATSVVGNALAGITGASNIGALSNLLSSTSKPAASTSGPQEFLSQSNMHNSSSQHNITSAPSLNTTIPKPTATIGSSCPAATTETCTVTETWHMTKYEKTATFFTFADVYTVTCTETISSCSSPTPAANATMPKPAIACANGDLVKREEDCPLPNYAYNETSSNTAPTPTHPCPDHGYTCSECPDGYFCPPQQTPAQSCPCGYGWVCAHCSANYFCIPGPSSENDNKINSVASLLANATVAASPMASVTATGPLKTNAPDIPAAAGALGLNPSSTSAAVSPVPSDLVLKAAIPAVSQITSAAGNAAENSMMSSVVGEIISALGKVSGMPGDFLAQVTAALASANAAPANVLPTVTPNVQNFPPVLNPISALAKQVQSQPTDVFSVLTTALPVVTIASGVLSLDRTAPERPVTLHIVSDPPGLLDGANAGGLKVRRRGVRKEEG